MENTVVIGAQWGDEGKAKITDLLAEKADLIIRYQGGCNAGHTVVAGGKTYKFHMIPSGILYDKTICFIGAGTVIHPESFERELNELKAEGVNFKNLKISPLASITMPYHIEIDGYSEAHSGKGKAMNILDQLAEYSRLRVAEDKKKISLEEMKNIAIQTKNEKLCDFAFEKALKKDDLSFICECKKASPSKGLIEPDFRYLEIAREYEAAGADCISVLTEPKWFLGSDEYLKEIAKTVSIPCIRKDFTVDEYQIYQAKTLGAAAVLLICSILSDVQLGEYIKICDSLGISALVEIHNEKEAGMAVRAGARIIGVNNRNLKDLYRKAV